MLGYDRLRGGRIQFVRVNSWQFWLAVVIAVTLVLTLAIVAASAFLIVFPIVVIVALLYRLADRLGWRRTKHQRPQTPDVIDGEYVILSDDRIDRR
jgi:predicted membrane metal-binding protein